ncbi:hypothetical protein CLOM_g11126 [Closterium sp. NIES-68]|nr:hypothetical protein CLOM_g11126 [Closterium sp. NIES-68]
MGKPSPAPGMAATPGVPWRAMAVSCSLLCLLAHLHLVACQTATTSATISGGASSGGGGASFNYTDALAKAILFFDAQRSGRISGAGASMPTGVAWRNNSGLGDGAAQQVDLEGGYYEGGGAVKYGLPAAFAATMLAWSLVDFRRHLEAAGGAAQLTAARNALRWSTDYLVKAHTGMNELWAQVGDPVADSACWQRPEDMSTPRTAYRVNASHPGSDLAAETAAALAAASLALRPVDAGYASTLLGHAEQLFVFADSYRGSYSDAVPQARRFSTSGDGSSYQDELAWAAAWLHRATGYGVYAQYLATNDAWIRGSDSLHTEMSWQQKLPGAQVLVAQMLLQGLPASLSSDVAVRATFEGYRGMADLFVCAHMPANPLRAVYTTPAGLLYVRRSPAQLALGAAFLLALHADSLAASAHSVQCDGVVFPPAAIVAFAQSQVDYLLGSNPLGLSFMVGFGAAFPQRLHHRGASIVSVNANTSLVTCDGGVADWLNRNAPNPNVLVGAIVGGPDESDGFQDSRLLPAFTEPSACANAPAVGLLSRLAAGPLPSAPPHHPSPLLLPPPLHAQLLPRLLSVPLPPPPPSSACRPLSLQRPPPPLQWIRQRW